MLYRTPSCGACSRVFVCVCVCFFGGLEDETFHTQLSRTRCIKSSTEFLRIRAFVRGGVEIQGSEP